MDKELAEAILDRLGEEGYEANLYEGYSGRGMYGAQTTAIVLKYSYDWERARKDVKELQVLRHDSLGTGVIFY